MFFHSNAFTMGMTKKGEINKIRTKPRPANGSLINNATATPKTTVMAITLPSSSKVLPMAVMNEGSVTVRITYSDQRMVLE